MSDIASTSSSGQSSRQYPQTFVADISRRVDVPVVPRAALGAGPRANIERHCFAYRTATRACLGAWKPSPAFNERLAATLGFVFQKTRQHAPTRIRYRAGQSMIFEYTLHIQMFDGDDLVFVYDPSRQFVQVVLAGACDAFMRTSDQLPRFIAALRSFLLAR